MRARMGFETGPVTIFTISALIAVTVAILNPVTILAIVTTPSLRRHHSNIFLINLAVVDLMMVALMVSGTAQYMIGPSNQAVCVMGIVIIGTVATASLFSCFAIAVDRFLFIHKALVYPTIVTYARVIKTVVAIWCVSLLLGFLPLMDGQLLRLPRCINPMTPATCAQGILVLSLFFIAGFISVGLYTKLFFVIREHNKVLETHALAHCRAHDCRRQKCRLSSRLGECRFRHDGQGSSYVWTARESSGVKGEAVSPKPILSSNKSFTSVPSALSLTGVASSVMDDDTSSVMLPLGEQSNTGPVGQNERDTDHQHGCHATGKESTLEREDRLNKTGIQHVKKRKKKKKIRFHKCQHLRDLWTIKTLMMMFAIYFICWAPLMLLKFSNHVLWIKPNQVWLCLAWILAVSNSLWNFLVYPMRKKELRAAIFHVLKKCTGRHRHHDLLQSRTTNTSDDNNLRSSTGSSRLD